MKHDVPDEMCMTCMHTRMNALHGLSAACSKPGTACCTRVISGHAWGHVPEETSLDWTGDEHSDALR